MAGPPTLTTENVIIAYQDDAGTKWAVETDFGQQNLLLDVVTNKGIFSPPTPFNQCYENLAALQAVSGWAGVQMAPAGLQLRTVKIALSNGYNLLSGGKSGSPFLSVNVVCGHSGKFGQLTPTGATPLTYPALVDLTGMRAQIAGITDETRLSN